MSLACADALLSKPKADDGGMGLGIGACKRQLRCTLGMDLAEGFAWLTTAVTKLIRNGSGMGANICRSGVQMCVADVRKKTKRSHECEFLWDLCGGYVLVALACTHAEGGI